MVSRTVCALISSFDPFVSIPTWLVASTECRGRKSPAVLRDEKAHRSGQVEVNVYLFLVYVISLPNKC
jgi:hypothetical protein